MFSDDNASSARESEDDQHFLEYDDSDIDDLFDIRPDSSVPSSPESTASTRPEIPDFPTLVINFPEFKIPPSAEQANLPGLNDGGYHSVGSRMQALTLGECGCLNLLEAFTYISLS
jgi:hypothetical protein